MYAFFNRQMECLAVGERNDAAVKAFGIRFVNRVLTAKPLGFGVVEFHSYDDSFNEKEMLNDAVRFLIHQGKQVWGISTFQQISS